MNFSWLLPTLVFLPMAGALAAYITGRRTKTGRDFFADALAAAEFVLLCCLLGLALKGRLLTCSLPRLLGGLSFEADGFRALYALIAGLMWLMTTVFSRQYLAHYRNRNRYYFFTLMTFGATLGVFLSAELITTFIFFEIMSFTSYVMVVHDENEGAMRAGQTYLAVAVLGGMVMLMGLFLLKRLTGTLVIGELQSACAALPQDKRKDLYLAGALILISFGAKAGMFPLHIWLPKAHPVAPAPASALLSGILTKAGIFGILVLSCRVFLHDAAWGRVILILGVITMFTGALLAVFSVNLKRTLACSSVSQIGFILVGVGMQCLLGEENTLAVWGTELHMVNHSLLKLVLFMSAGAVYMNLHKLDLNDIRGFGRGKPLLMLIFLSGYLGISGVPLFNGYISKTLLHEGIVEYIEALEAVGKSILPMKCVEWIFLFSGGLTAAYMTKLFFAVFVEKNADAALQAKYDGMNGHYMNAQSIFALGLPAVILPIIGSFPSVFMKGMAELGQGFMNGASPAHAIRWFSLTNLKGAAISLLIGAVVYVFVIRRFLMTDDGSGMNVDAAGAQDEGGSTIRYKGQLYRYNDKVSSVLFMGIDDFQKGGEVEHGDGTQSDVNVMAVLDPENEKLSIISISRDTMCEIEVFDSEGNSQGLSRAQLALSYSYGDGLEQSCELTSDAVSRLFYDLSIPAYGSIYMDGIVDLVDAVGGVTITQDDGQQVNLDGAQAKRYIRYRAHTVEGNNERMQRQSLVMKALVYKALASVKEDPAAILDIYNSVKDNVTTNLNASKIVYLAQQAAKIGFNGEIDKVPGRSRLADDGEHAEYIVDEDAFFDMVLDTFYIPIEG